MRDEFSKALRFAPFRLRSGELSAALARVPAELLAGHDVRVHVSLAGVLPDGTSISRTAEDLAVLDPLCEFASGAGSLMVSVAWSPSGARHRWLLYLALGGERSWDGSQVTVHVSAASLAILDAVEEWLPRALPLVPSDPEAPGPSVSRAGRARRSLPGHDAPSGHPLPRPRGRGRGEGAGDRDSPLTRLMTVFRQLLARFFPR